MSPTLFVHEDPALREAVRRAHESFPFFVREMVWERRRVVKGAFLSVKVAFDVPPQPHAPETEQMWLTNVSFDGVTLSGALFNTSRFLPQLKSGDEVAVPLDRLVDWMCVAGGVVCGAFTVQALRAAMTGAERAEHDAQWGDMPFPDPELCNITPYDAQAPRMPMGLGRFFGKAVPAASGLTYEDALARARASEHPMSISTRDKLQDVYRNDPDLMMLPDAYGLTPLHLDALAGNQTQVEMLLSNGADWDSTTPDGRTALDIARAMGWDDVARLLAAWPEYVERLRQR